MARRSRKSSAPYKKRLKRIRSPYSLPRKERKYNSWEEELYEDIELEQEDSNAST